MPCSDKNTDKVILSSSLVLMRMVNRLIVKYNLAKYSSWDVSETISCIHTEKWISNRIEMEIRFIFPLAVANWHPNTICNGRLSGTISMLQICSGGSAIQSYSPTVLQDFSPNDGRRPELHSKLKPRKANKTAQI